MAHDTTLNTMVGGDVVTTYDLAAAGAYPTTGKVPASVLYVSPNATTAPTPVTAANGLYVQPGTGVTFAVSAAALPLPAGAATAAKQAAIGTAGSASADVLTVQGIASMTALKVDASATTQPISGTVAVSSVGGTVAVTTQQSNFTADYDSGAGTQNLTMFGMALPASGGAVAGGTSTNPVRTDPTGTTTQPVSGTVTANAGTGTFTTQARTATTDAITVYQATDKINNGLTQLTPKFAFANATASGDTTVVAAVSGKKIRVLSFKIGPVSAAVNVYLKSHTAGAIQSTNYLVANGGVGRAYSPIGHCETTAGEALDINLSGTANVGVDVEYVEV